MAWVGEVKSCLIGDKRVHFGIFELGSGDNHYEGWQISYTDSDGKPRIKWYPRKVPDPHWRDGKWVGRQKPATIFL